MGKSPISFNMSRTMQNVILFLEPSDDQWNVSTKAGNSYFNRIGVDEDAGFELLGVYHLKKAFWDIDDKEYEAERKEKEEFDSKIFDSAIKKAAENKEDDLKIHFIVA